MQYRTNDPELAPNVPHTDRGFDRRRDDADRSEMDRGPSDAANLAAANLVAMGEIARRAQTYPETATSRVDAGAIAPNTVYILAAKLHNVPIRSAYFENGTNAPISVFRGTTGQGAPIIVVNPGSYATFNLGSDITEISAPVPHAASSGIVMLSVTDRVWVPSRNFTVAAAIPTTLPGTGGVTQTSNAGLINVNVPAGAAAFAIVTGPGRMASVLVLATGTAILRFTDGPGGVVIAYIKVSAAAGDRILVDMTFAISLYCNSGVGTAQVTVSYD